jgi:glycosyl transferase family 1
VNAWLAGVPAVVAPEPAFEALRRSPLDFIATADGASTFEAIRGLAAAPERYQAMVENGRARAAEFTVEAIRERWLHLLLEEAVPGFEHMRASPGTRIARYATFVLRMSAQKLEAKRFRARERRERAALSGS